MGTRLHANVRIPLLNKFFSGFFKVHENDADQYFQTIAGVAWVKSTGTGHLMGLRFATADQDLC